MLNNYIPRCREWVRKMSTLYLPKPPYLWLTLGCASQLHPKTVTSCRNTTNIRLVNASSASASPKSFGEIRQRRWKESSFSKYRFCFQFQILNFQSPDDNPQKKERRSSKGKVPWNKGKKHSEETRALIKQRTIEALQNPKVRKKMSEHPLPHSAESKKKISSSLKKLWAKRLQRKRLQDTMFFTWAESIAKYAKKGGYDQQELDWDSYDNIKKEIALEENLRVKAKARERKIAAYAKAQRMSRVTQRRKDQEVKNEARAEMKTKANKSVTAPEKYKLTKELKLRQKLQKVRKIILNNGHVVIREEAVPTVPAWEKFDKEMIRRQKADSQVSLQEQIQDAKNKRRQPVLGEALATFSVVNNRTRTMNDKQ